jgi:phosphatidylglycerol---prolipoprotein diacylglyceryl transferase
MLPHVDVLGLQVRTFGLAFALAFLLAGLLMARRLREIGKPSEWAFELLLAAAIGGVVGSRLYFILQNGAGSDPLATALSGTGLIWYGGVVGGALAVLAWARYRGFLGLGLLDLAAPALALGYAVGRVGCQLTGDGTYGQVSNLPWAMGYPHGTDPTPPGVTVQPTPVYETLAMGLVALWLWRMRDTYRPGVLFGFYLVLAGAERLLVEFVRRNQDVVLGLTAAQLESIGLIVAGVCWLSWTAARGGLRPAPSRRPSRGSQTPPPGRVAAS